MLMPRVGRAILEYIVNTSWRGLPIVNMGTEMGCLLKLLVVKTENF